MIPFYLFFLISVCPLFDLSFPFPLMTLYWHRKSLLLGLSAIRSKNLYRQSGREHGRLGDTRLVFFGPVNSFLFAGYWKTRADPSRSQELEFRPVCFLAFDIHTS
jgi:hypothetical protein